jgi:ribosome biogenesis GTPase
MPKGLIVKALSGYYYVQSMEDGHGDKKLIQCRARGIFKKKGITPLVGDQVIFTLTENDEGTVDEIYPRSSELIRPPISNVDLAVLVFSLREPDLNLKLLDKFLVHTETSGLDTVICFSKRDLGNEDNVLADDMTLNQVSRLYEDIGYEVIITSAKTGEGADQVRQRLSRHIGVFAGQSGVGKSSLLNVIFPGLSLATNEISAKLGRGKHTTRHVELIALEDGGWIADSPGFSQLDFMNLEAEDMTDGFKEFRKFSPQCKFRGCLHRNEPGCRVKEAVESGGIARSRYEHYLLFLGEIMDRKRRY